jgi:hypothetical protein
MLGWLVPFRVQAYSRDNHLVVAFGRASASFSEWWGGNQNANCKLCRGKPSQISGPIDRPFAPPRPGQGRAPP